jgi:hypothetical protein
VKEARHASGKACRGKVSGTASPLTKGRNKKSYRSLDAVPERNQGRTGVTAMYKGTLIEDLTKTVERAEAHVREANQEGELERWYAAHHQRALADAELLGVA